jgi:prepilin-type N-terminal cleavage/methylation domain-containing protein
MRIKTHQNINKSKGFTLVELAIVIVIIGIIISILVSGKNIITAMKINSFASNIRAIGAAANFYYEEYKKIPGDDDTASAKWPNCGDTLNASAASCNGSGGGAVAYYDSNDPTNDEWALAYMHLSLAGLLEKGSDGYVGSNFKAPRVPEALPDIYEGMTAIIASHVGNTSDASIPAGASNLFNLFNFDSNRLMLISYYGEQYLTLVSMIDEKIDDGIAITGNFVARDGCKDKSGGSTSCFSNSYPSNTWLECLDNSNNYRTLDYTDPSTGTGCMWVYRFGKTRL